MSQINKDFEITKVAGELMTQQYYIVQLDASGNIEYGEGATDKIVGVLQNKPRAGEAALYRFAGTSKVVASGAISIGDWLTSHANGRALTTTTDGNLVIGRALEAATAAGDIIEVQLSVQHLYIA